MVILRTCPNMTLAVERDVKPQLCIHTFYSVYLVMYFIHIFVDVCVYCLVKVFINFIGAV